ncbi:MAG: BON domain-containing protein [Acidobacteriota bacterium]|nr:BON domain-containing protein [Acidobacteriota bacterium]
MQNCSKCRNALVPGLAVLSVMAGLCLFLAANGDAFAEDRDAAIESAARKSYIFKTFLKSDDIQIHSKDGVVTLTGTVAGEPHSLLAAETVADLPGVVSVINQLEIRGGIPEKNSDAWIQTRVKNMLLLHRNLDSDNIVVDVKDGLVTLHGEVGSQAERGLTAEYVKDVEGVKDIENKLTVATSPKKKSRTVEEYIDDASVKSQIKLMLLFHRGTNPLRTNIIVDRGVVTVSGVAKNAAERELVNKRIEDIRGVVRIDNRMTIE